MASRTFVLSMLFAWSIPIAGFAQRAAAQQAAAGASTGNSPTVYPAAQPTRTGGAGRDAGPSARSNAAAVQPTAVAVSQAQPAVLDQQEIFRRSGGSLLRASLASPLDPMAARVRDVSYFAVPEPEPKTLKKHDLVSVIVREESQSNSAGTTDLKKTADLDAKIDAFVKLNLNRLRLDNSFGANATSTPEIKISGTRNFKGEGTVDRTDSVTLRVTAEIIDVKPNNTLVLQARKRIKTDEEEQFFVLTGICRAEDIGPDNTVLSTQLFDLELQKNNKGAVRDANTRGWVPRLLDALNPF